LAGLLRRPDDGIAFNKHFDGDSAIIFKHACALGCEGMVSKRLGNRQWSRASTSRSSFRAPSGPFKSADSLFERTPLTL
jgi:hypothetical protein